jgi:hypothetical protein
MQAGRQRDATQQKSGNKGADPKAKTWGAGGGEPWREPWRERKEERRRLVEEG